MDTTETYIKMCEKGEKIQKEWKPQLGDFFVEYDMTIDFHTNPIVIGNVCIYERIEKFYPHKDCVLIWLPRQDQLQEMVWMAEETINHLFARFWDFVAKDSVCNSFEQLWLAFVMKEKHNKIWNGEKWMKNE